MEVLLSFLHMIYEEYEIKDFSTILILNLQKIHLFIK